MTAWRYAYIALVALLALAALILLAAVYYAFGRGALQVALIILAFASVSIGQRNVIAHHARRTGRHTRDINFFDLSMEDFLQAVPFVVGFFALGAAAVVACGA